VIPEGTSKYVQGVELPLDYHKPLPEDYEEAISGIWELMKTYDPKLYGYEWADDESLRFQLSPMGYRGYIEARPVRPVNPVR
jgi:AraC family transcriptional regulator